MKIKSRGLKEEVNGQVSRSGTTLLTPNPPPHSPILNKELSIQTLSISSDAIQLWDNIHQIPAASCENSYNNNDDT